MEDDVPIVVRICCHVIEQRLEQDGTGIYRRNGNKPIVDQLEDEMNKNIETMKSDHELMKGQGQICYFFNPPYPYLIVRVILTRVHFSFTLTLARIYQKLILRLR